MPYPGEVAGGFGEDDRFVRVPIEMLSLWDISKKPTTNDRDKKAGSGMALKGGAIAEVDENSNSKKMVDGITEVDGKSPPELTSLILMEPDNWVLRFHETEGKGVKSNWAVRLIADHHNFSTECEQRSTMVVDQAGDDETISWAFVQDQWWLVNLNTPVNAKELVFNGAGFLAMLYPDAELSEADYTRCALALNMAGNAGYLTQGTLIGQLDHVLVLVPPDGGTVSAFGARPIIKTEAALRGDVHFYLGRGKLAQFCDEKQNPKENEYDEPRLVHFFVSKMVAPLLGQQAALDPKSNHQPIDRPGATMWLGWVKIPRHTCDKKYDKSYHGRKRRKRGSGGGGAAVETGHGDRYPTSNPTGDYNPDGSAINTQLDSTSGGIIYDAAEYAVVAGEWVPDSADAGSVECQYGGVPGASPASQWVNIYPHWDTNYINPSSRELHTKPAGYTKFALEILLKPSAQVLAGQLVTMDYKVVAFTDDTPPLTFADIYGRRIEIDNTWTYGVDGQWTRKYAYFTGFEKEECELQFFIERRCDNRNLDPDYDADVEIWEMKTALIPYL